MTRQPAITSYLLCLRNAGYEASLEARKIYAAIPDAVAAQRGMVRVIDESGEDYLYAADRFSTVRLPAAAKEALAAAAQV